MTTLQQAVTCDTSDGDCRGLLLYQGGPADVLAVARSEPVNVIKAGDVFYRCAGII
ncbi:hypothetical protein ACIGBL_34565 [Streptomyces sp. NPDC085614]|uniref:hypothetical protein n=1 Tax=Streptomyces sp. NPDC085614 TaxID=3365733 RepID=UPI0037D699FC